MGIASETTDLADSDPTNRATATLSGGRVRGGAHHTARWIVTVAALGLTALSLALAAPAAAHGPHDGGTGPHTAATAAHARADGAKPGTPPSSHTERLAADPPASESPIASDPVLLAGHDKCKKSKGDRGYPPWCTDPSTGWMGTLHRAEPSYSTAASDKGIGRQPYPLRELRTLGTGQHH